MDPFPASGSSHPSGSARRSTRSDLERVLVVMRAPRDWAQEAVVEGQRGRTSGKRAREIRPRLWREEALLVLAYTFFGRKRRLFGARHHLVYHVPVVCDPPEAASTIILRRECSAWLEARLQAALAHPAPIRSRFFLNQRGSALRLAVERPDAEQLELRALRANGWRPGLFLSRHELAEFLGESRTGTSPTSPAGLLAPELAIEPAIVEESHGLLPFQQAGGFDVECAVRLRPVVHAPATEVTRQTARRDERSAAAPA